MLKAEAILKICQCGYQCNKIYVLRGSNYDLHKLFCKVKIFA